MQNSLRTLSSSRFLRSLRTNYFAQVSTSLRDVKSEPETNGTQFRDSLPLPEAVAPSLGAMFLTDAARHVAAGLNISPFKGIVRTHMSLNSVRSLDTLAGHDKRHRHPIRENVNQLQRILRMDTQGDMVDAEVVYFATVGFHDHTRPRATLCVTMDPEPRIRTRLAMMRAAWVFVRDTRKRAPKIKFGAVAFIDKSGKISAIQRIADIDWRAI